MVKNLNPIKGTIIPVTKGNIIPYDPKNQGESISGKTYKTRGKIPTMNEPMSYLLLKIQWIFKRSPCAPFRAAIFVAWINKEPRRISPAKITWLAEFDSKFCRICLPSAWKQQNTKVFLVWGQNNQRGLDFTEFKLSKTLESFSLQQNYLLNMGKFSYYDWNILLSSLPTKVPFSFFYR